MSHADYQHLELSVLMPTRVVLKIPAQQVAVETSGGSRGFLPNHIDFVAALATGIVSYVDLDGATGFAAVDGGVLVKKGPQLLIATPDAVHAQTVSDLEQFIRERSYRQQENERVGRGAMARLEVALVRRLMELSRR